MSRLTTPPPIPLALMLLSTMGCALGRPSEEDMKTLVVEATSAPVEQLAPLVEYGFPPVQEIDDQNATVVFAALARPLSLSRDRDDSFSRRSPTRGIEYLGQSLVSPDQMKECLVLPGGAEDEPRASLVAEESITEIQFTFEGGSASGTVHFERDGCFRGRLPFVARKGPDGWRVDELTLPELDWRVERQPDGSWRATPVGSAPAQLADVVLVDAPVVYVQAVGPLEVDAQALNRAEDLLARVAGKAVVLRVHPEAPIEDALAAIELLRDAEPPVTGIGFLIQREIESFWSYAIEVTDGPDLPELRASILTSGSTVRRSSLPGQAATICLDLHSAGTIYRVATGDYLPLAVGTDEDVITFAATEVARNPDRLFVIDTAGGSRYERLDAILDALVQAKARRALWLTAMHEGVLFEFREDGPTIKKAAERPASARRPIPKPKSRPQSRQ